MDRGDGLFSQRHGVYSTLACHRRLVREICLVGLRAYFGAPC